jgi:hypothetical protein
MDNDDFELWRSVFTYARDHNFSREKWLLLKDCLGESRFSGPQLALIRADFQNSGTRMASEHFEIYMKAEGAFPKNSTIEIRV